MSYIGKEPTIGNFQKCDAISVVNGQATYGLTVNSVAVYPESANHVLCSLNGILQAPTDSFTISSSNIVFASNLSTGDVIDFVMILGNVLDLGVPSDNTVSTAKIVDGAITSAKLGSGVGGKILQVLTATDTSVRTTTSTSFVTSSNTLSVNITPSSTSSKIFVLANTTFRIDANSTQAFITIYRDSTNLGNSTDGISNIYSDSAGALWTPACISVLDSPSSTSQLTYQVYFRTNNASVTARINQDSKGSITVFEVGA